ncbi:MAG: hypothetical protein SH857_19015 [Chitinophagales bacterium]|nr:hypothetical protein [Chitinophagales bacterium]
MKFSFSTTGPIFSCAMFSCVKPCSSKKLIRTWNMNVTKDTVATWQLA